MDENEIGSIVVECVIHVYRNLGSGLLETVYQVILARELEKRALNVK